MADALAAVQPSVPLVAWSKAASAEEAARAAGTLGFPAVLKMDAPGLVHKTEAGAVRLGLRDAAEVAAAYRDAEARLAKMGHPPRAALVMATAAPGVELLLGGLQDPRYGPVVALGLGGIHVETLQDTVFRLAPVTEEEAMRALRSLRGWPLLRGTRGAPPADVQAIAAAVASFSRFLAAHPEVSEAEVNPLFAGPHGVAGVDARVHVTEPAA